MTKIYPYVYIFLGYQDLGEFWRSSYEVQNFASLIQELWNVLKPLYLQLHAYVRNRLRIVYGKKVNQTGPLPAHLLGELLCSNKSVS